MKFRLIFYQESLSKNGMNQPVIQRLKKLSSACYMQHIISILEPDKVFILLWPLFGTTLSRKSNRNWMNIDLIYSTGRFREIIITWVMWYLTYRMHHYLCHILEVSEIAAERADFTFWQNKIYIASEYLLKLLIQKFLIFYQMKIFIWVEELVLHICLCNFLLACIEQQCRLLSCHQRKHGPCNCLSNPSRRLEWNVLFLEQILITRIINASHENMTFLSGHKSFLLWPYPGLFQSYISISAYHLSTARAYPGSEIGFDDQLL